MATRSFPAFDWVDPFIDEAACVTDLLTRASMPPDDARATTARARTLVAAIRKGRRQKGGIEEFMHEYGLTNEEGVALMCLAESLLRIPDSDTQDRLIADKIGGADWERHLGRSPSLFVNASTWGLMLTGQIVGPDAGTQGDPFGFIANLVKRAGEPVIRTAVRHAMHIMGRQFVLGRTIDEALANARADDVAGYRFSYDMLGEAARTEQDALRYFEAYTRAIKATGLAQETLPGTGDIFGSDSVSIKLSALYPRYEELKTDEVMRILLPRVDELVLLARQHNIGITIDAEEMERLAIGLEVFAAAWSNPALDGWQGLGLAVQAYSRRAMPVLEWLARLARAGGRKIPVRLVKGAYWDTEIKAAQQQGLRSFPVFTRKASTDVSYLACARYLLDHRDVFFPQFASHNAHTLSAVVTYAGDDVNGFECQRLHGMGQALFDEVVDRDGLNLPARIYAPVGSHEDLLAYLVRRLLENGANSSFVNRLSDDALPIDEIVRDPVSVVTGLDQIPHPSILAPGALFEPRVNAKGVALWDRPERDALEAKLASVSEHYTATPIINGNDVEGGKAARAVCPHNHDRQIGMVSHADDAQMTGALAGAKKAQTEWDRLGGVRRAEILCRAADLFERETPGLLRLIVLEAGKTVANALGDIREAVDFLRYYADGAANDFAEPESLPGPTGETNTYRLCGRGVFVAISPWNFPVAIFTGQIAAALAAGNAVIAKPAEQTPMTAHFAVRLLHRAGVPGEVLQFLPGPGSRIGAGLVAAPETGGVVFTGSNATASVIHQSLARRTGPILPFIAETGGINVMLADSSALPEQVVRDAVASAFDSAGQRCSAARILCLHNDIADRVIDMLAGAMDMLRVGDPEKLDTDIGPVIDEEARAILNTHKADMAAKARTIFDAPLGAETGAGTFVGPAAFELDDLSLITKEVFGPILHVVRYSGDRLDRLIDDINAKGFGLTFGLHTRLTSTMDYLSQRIDVGNIYINRNQIGAVVGSQPFGGHGLSGTGPKAGGPQYLARFAKEVAISTDVTATGGNTELLSLTTA